MTMAEIKAAGAILFAGRTVPKFLLLQASKHREWGPPKGHADGQEKDVETALREIEEETGLSGLSFIDGFRRALTYTVERKGKSRQKEVVLFLSELNSERPPIALSDEHIAWRMATIKDVERLVNHDDILAIFHEADAFVKGMG
jgi:8-oxo-dGTP pyrophosphatase MutT (NUDIX family)